MINCECVRMWSAITHAMISPSLDFKVCVHVHICMYVWVSVCVCYNTIAIMVAFGFVVVLCDACICGLLVCVFGLGLFGSFPVQVNWIFFSFGIQCFVNDFNVGQCVWECICIPRWSCKPCQYSDRLHEASEDNKLDGKIIACVIAADIRVQSQLIMNVCGTITRSARALVIRSWFPGHRADWS
jgi:hypothetical protein